MAWDEPYPGLNSTAVMRNVASGKLRPEKLDKIPPVLWELMEKMWAQDPKTRPPFSLVTSALEKMKVGSSVASEIF